MQDGGEKKVSINRIPFTMLGREKKVAPAVDKVDVGRCELSTFFHHPKVKCSSAVVLYSIFARLFRLQSTSASQKHRK